MMYYDYYNDLTGDEDFPEYFEVFDESLKKGTNPGYFEPEELCEIADIYFSEDKMSEGKYVVEYALRLYPENEDLIYDLLLILNDYELWNDLLTFCENYKKLNQVWIDGHKITALLHLGIEEDAFQCFKKAKSKYANNREDISLIYQVMAESLLEVDLFEASIEVVEEILAVDKEDPDLYWLQMEAFAALGDNESVIELGGRMLEISPMDAETWSRLGDTYKNIGELDRAIEAFEFAQSLGLKDPNNLLGMIYTYEKNGNYLKALQKVDEYLDEYSDNYLIHLLAINICLSMEDWEKGLEYAENAIASAPQMESLYFYKCKFYLKLGENIKALKTLEEGIRKTLDISGDLKKQLDILKEEKEGER